MPKQLKDVRIEAQGGSYTPGPEVWADQINGCTCVYKGMACTATVKEEVVYLKDHESGNEISFKAEDLHSSATIAFGTLVIGVKIASGGGQIRFGINAYSEKPGRSDLAQES